MVAHRPSLATLLLGLALMMACGGKAVLDDGAGGGGGGVGGSTGSTSPVCFTPEPASELFECGGSTTGSGAGAPCERTLCDTSANSWRSRCEGQGCVCYYNGSVRCSCALQGDGAFCDGVTPSCCPEPFPPF